MEYSLCYFLDSDRHGCVLSSLRALHIKSMSRNTIRIFAYHKKMWFGLLRREPISIFGPIFEVEDWLEDRELSGARRTW